MIHFGKKPDISVIVPVYNVEEDYMRACFNTLLNQTKDNIEVILIDDGSTNNSGEIADEYAKKYEHFKCWHIKNQGVGHARNFGVKKAKGEYITFADPDDIVAPDIYEKLYRAAERNGSDMAICNAKRFNSQKTVGSNLHLFAFKDLDSITHITKSPALIYDAAVWNKLVKRSLWKKHRISMPEDIWYEDVPVAAKLHFYANNVSVIRETGYMWRMREAGEKSITQHAKELTNLSDRIETIKILTDFLEKEVKDEGVIHQKNVKALTFDFMIFINTCLELDKSRVQQAMKMIKEYALTLTSTKAFESLNTVEKALYQAIFDDDYERFVLIADFRKNVLPNLPYFEKDGRVFSKLPGGLFNEEIVDVTDKVRRSVPRFFINRVIPEGSQITVRTSLYIPKISMPDKSEQKVKMFLVNEMTGEQKPLKVKPFKNSWVTKTKGGWACQETGEEGSYNYDGTGYSVTLDENDMRPETAQNLVIVAKYENRYIKGTAAINNLAEYATE